MYGKFSENELSSLVNMILKSKISDIQQEAKTWPKENFIQTLQTKLLKLENVVLKLEGVISKVCYFTTVSVATARRTNIFNICGLGDHSKFEMKNIAMEILKKLYGLVYAMRKSLKTGEERILYLIKPEHVDLDQLV